MFEMARSNNQGARTIQTIAHHGLAVQYARTDIRKHSFTRRVAVKWNRLPDSVKMAPSKESFKRGLRQRRKKNGIEVRREMEHNAK